MSRVERNSTLQAFSVLNYADDKSVTWLLCEVEALSIAVATRHFSSYIIQSKHRACILTDSKPCVKAYEKLCHGEFYANPHVSTSLSIVSRYKVSV